MAETQTGDQAAQPQSLMDRIASAFGETPEPKEQPVEYEDQPEEASADAEADTESSEDAEEQKPADEFVEIEFEGEKLQIPAHLSKVKDALLRQADYTQKTQKVAEQQRALETAQEALKIQKLGEQFQESTRDERKYLDILDAAIEQAKKLDWASMSTDQIVRARMELDGYKEQRQQIAESLKAKEAEFRTKADEHFKTLRSQAREVVQKAIPQYDEKALTEWFASEGLTSQEIEGVLADPRSARIAWKARQYDQLQAQKTQAVEKAKSAPPVIKPSAHRQMPDDVKEKLNFRKQLSKVSDPVQRAKLHEQRLAKLFGA